MEIVIAEHEVTLRESLCMESSIIPAGASDASRARLAAAVLLLVSLSILPGSYIRKSLPKDIYGDFEKIAMH